MAITRIKKRDGREVYFDPTKITGAIDKAFNATYKPGNLAVAEQLTKEVCSILEVEGCTVPEVEHIQDLVERVLMDNGYVQTAKAYILYRAERSKRREMNTRLMQTYEEITFADAKDSDVKRENANIDGDTAMGTMLKYGSEGAKQFYNMFVLKPEHAKAHAEGDIHIRTSTPSPPPALRSISRSCSRAASPPVTVISASPTISPATPHWPASQSSPTRTISTADRPS